MSHFFSFQQALFSELGLLECFIGTTFKKKSHALFVKYKKKEVALDVSNVTHMARHPIIECRVEITT